MTCHYTIYRNIDRVPTGSWQAVCHPGDDTFMDPRFLRLFEQTMIGEAEYHYVLVHNDSGEPAGAACFSLCDLDGALFCEGFVARGIDRIRQFWPRYLKFRALFCGLPFSGGQSHVRLAPNADRAAVAECLDTAAVSLAGQAGSWLIIFKEFSPKDEDVMQALVRMGYMRTESLPMNCADMRFRGLDDFSSALRSHYRYKIRRSQRKFREAGMRVEHLQGQNILDIYTDEVHRLYEAVVDRAEIQLERLPAQFFREMVRALPEYIKLTAVRFQDRIVAFAWSMDAGGIYRDLFVGIDYDFDLDCDLYFNLMATDLAFGYQSKASELHMGQSADVFKSRLGCRHDPRYVCVKALPLWLRLPFRATSRWLFPSQPPPPERDLFHGPAETSNI